MIGPDGKISEANVAARSSSDIGARAVAAPLRDLVPFGSPLLALIEQVRAPRGRRQRVPGSTSARPRNPASVSSI